MTTSHVAATVPLPPPVARPQDAQLRQDVRWLAATLGRVVAFSSAGVDPSLMGIGPVPAVRSLLERTGLSLPDIDLIEINEAFASQVLACQRDLGFDLARTNVLGGALALGHPIGATGARITVTLMHELRRRAVRYGLATLCISGGQGIAMLLENPDAHPR